MSILKMNWGTRILLLYLSFVALIITLVYRSMKTDFDLVTKDYYSEEIKYQEVIDAGKNHATLSAPVQLTQEGERIVILFPKEFKGIRMKSSLQFYAAVNAKWDKTFALDVDDARAELSIAGMQAANYVAKLKWSYNNKPYYQESVIKIHPNE